MPAPQEMIGGRGQQAAGFHCRSPICPADFCRSCLHWAASQNPRRRISGQENPPVQTVFPACRGYPRPGIKRHPARESLFILHLQEFTQKPIPQLPRLLSLFQIGNLFQGTMQGNAFQMGFNCQAGTRDISITARQRLPPAPKRPTLIHAQQSCLAKRENIQKITRRPPFHQGIHLARHQVSQAVQRNIDPASRTEALPDAACERQFEN